MYANAWPVTAYRLLLPNFRGAVAERTPARFLDLPARFTAVRDCPTAWLPRRIFAVATNAAGYKKKGGELLFYASCDKPRSRRDVKLINPRRSGGRYPDDGA